jgi:sigma-B regulation protein RsbU (phosphoserine phosphatase)
MQKGLNFWRRLGGLDKTFLLCVLAYAVVAVVGRTPFAQSLLALAAVLTGLLALFQLARRTIRTAIWRLRNRLIAAYLLIAVVPVILILTLVGLAGYAVIGQMAVYLVNTELRHREDTLMRQAVGLAQFPVGQPERGLNRFVAVVGNSWPSFELLATGERELRYPPTGTLIHPPDVWPKRAHELVLRREGRDLRLYAWAHVSVNGEQVTVLAPITHDLLAALVPGLGDVNFVPLMEHPRQSRIPAPKSAFDFRISGFYPIKVPLWDNPDKVENPILVVDTRISAVLGTVFQKLDWAETALYLFIGITFLFFIFELVSLAYGIKLSRTITGAVHELYEGTQHVKTGDFAYRIPLKGSDQLAELAQSFNNMTENLGRLVVVAKEKERLESELAIAREVQDQLFPKDVPFTRTLELKGVCHPARMVSGDYYDFMSLSDSSLAFAIGDVAGKGISAALLMATIQSTMRTQLSATNGAGPLHFSTAKLVATLNRQLYATTAPEKYATFFFALYDDVTNALSYTNAGHLAPILLRGSTLSTFDSTGTVVGAFPIARYGEKTLELQQNDMLVAYTDGIVEPENAYGEMFGEERLKDLLVKYSSVDSSEIIARTMEAVNQWTGGGELQDDMTMVVARRL